MNAAAIAAAFSDVRRSALVSVSPRYVTDAAY